MSWWDEKFTSSSLSLRAEGLSEIEGNPTSSATYKIKDFYVAET